MLKLSYIAAFLIGTSFIGCEKKTAAPSQGATRPPVTKDTLSGRMYTYAGNPYDSTGAQVPFSGDGGPAIKATLNEPDGVCIDAAGNLYIADLYNERIRKVTAQGIISTIAGNGQAGYSGDGGPAVAAELDLPGGLAVDAAGNVYFADYDNSCIRKVSTSGIISTYAGNGQQGFKGDGGPANSAELNRPTGVAVDNAGNLYIADYQNDRIRKVNTNGIISTVAGGGNSNPVNGSPADSVILYAPDGVAVDASDNIYIASLVGSRIFKVNTNGIISTIAGSGSYSKGGYSGDGGPAVNAQLNSPTDVILDGSGNIYIADANNYVIRKIDVNGIITTYAGNGSASVTFVQGAIALDVGIGYLPSIAIDSKGNLYFTDLYFNRVQVIYK